MNNMWMKISVGILNTLGGLTQSVIGIVCIATFFTGGISTGWTGQSAMIIGFILPPILLLPGIPTLINGVRSLRKKKIPSLTGSVFAFYPMLVMLLFLTDRKHIYVGEYILYSLLILLGTISIVLNLLSRKQSKL